MQVDSTLSVTMLSIALAARKVNTYGTEFCLATKVAATTGKAAYADWSPAGAWRLGMRKPQFQLPARWGDRNLKPPCAGRNHVAGSAMIMQVLLRGASFAVARCEAKQPPT